MGLTIKIIPNKRPNKVVKSQENIKNLLSQLNILKQEEIKKAEELAKANAETEKKRKIDNLHVLTNTTDTSE